MTKFALYVPLQAKSGKEKEVADFLRSAVPLVNAEMGTISWFAIQEGPSSFAIFDTFNDEVGRNAKTLASGRRSAYIFYMSEFSRIDYSVVVKQRNIPPKSWRWEIHRAGRSSPIKHSLVPFRTMATANRAGKEALKQLLDKLYS